MGIGNAIALVKMNFVTGTGNTTGLVEQSCLVGTGYIHVPIVERSYILETAEQYSSLEQNSK